MPTDLLYPILILAICALVAVVVHFRTRTRPSSSDAIAFAGHAALPPREPVGEIRRQLSDWHNHHGDAVLDFIEHHDSSLNSAFATESRSVALDTAIVEAVDSHPGAEMRAELAALIAAADAASDAQDRRDGDAIDRHTAVYLEYRGVWLERLWQFSADPERVTRLRHHPPATKR